MKPVDPAAPFYGTLPSFPEDPRAVAWSRSDGPLYVSPPPRARIAFWCGNAVLSLDEVPAGDGVDLVAAEQARMEAAIRQCAREAEEALADAADDPGPVRWGEAIPGARRRA